MSESAQRTKRPTTFGQCHVCGSDPCPIYRHAALTDDGHVDAEALMVAHGFESAVVTHDVDGKPTSGGAQPLAPMVSKESALYKRHGGRVAPLPSRKGIRR